MHTIQQNKGLVARLFATRPEYFHGSGPLRGIGRGAAWLLEAVLVWQDRANQRHRLRLLSDAALKDIGVSRLDAEREACKPFWQA